MFKYFIFLIASVNALGAGYCSVSEVESIKTRSQQTGIWLNTEAAGVVCRQASQVNAYLPPGTAGISTANAAEAIIYYLSSVANNAQYLNSCPNASYNTQYKNITPMTDFILRGMAQGCSPGNGINLENFWRVYMGDDRYFPSRVNLPLLLAFPLTSIGVPSLLQYNHPMITHMAKRLIRWQCNLAQNSYQTPQPIFPVTLAVPTFWYTTLPGAGMCLSTGNLGIIDPVGFYNTRPLYQCNRNTSKGVRVFQTTDPNGEGVGYQCYAVGGIFVRPNYGSVPVYRCRNSQYDTHMLSLSTNCDGMGTNEGQIGYARSAP